MSFESLMETRSAREYADFVLPAIRPGDRVLDVGCGPGSISVGMAAVGASVTGVDLDHAEFADAREYAKSERIENVTFVEGSIYDLEFPDASFDVCTCFPMLEVVERATGGIAGGLSHPQARRCPGRVVDRVRGVDPGGPE